jgi:hypothetical protein
MKGWKRCLFIFHVLSIDAIFIEILPKLLGCPCQSKCTLFADDTNIIISHPEIDCFQKCMNDFFASL